MFPLGKLLATTAALDAVEKSNQHPMTYFLKHQQLEQGALGESDWQQNKDAIVNGARVFSSFALPNGEKIWIITESTRELTTLLLPDEY